MKLGRWPNCFEKLKLKSFSQRKEEKQPSILWKMTNTIHSGVIIVILFNWPSCNLYFKILYPQNDISRRLFMKHIYFSIFVIMIHLIENKPLFFVLISDEMYCLLEFLSGVLNVTKAFPWLVKYIKIIHRKCYLLHMITLNLWKENRYIKRICILVMPVPGSDSLFFCWWQDVLPFRIFVQVQLAW